MTTQELTQLLVQIRDGDASPEVVGRASALLRLETALPEELRSEGLDQDDLVASAVGFLAVLGLDDGLGLSVREALWGEATGVELDPVVDDGWAPIASTLREGTEAEASVIDIVGDVFGALDLTEPAVPVAEAVQAEAQPREVFLDLLEDAALGELIGSALRSELEDVEIAEAVCAEIGIETQPLADALVCEAGTVDVVSQVMAAVGVQVTPVAEALESEAGSVDIVAEVLSVLGLEEQSLPLAEALVAECGQVDISEAIEQVTSEAWASAMVDGELSSSAHRLATMRLIERPELGRQMTVFTDTGRNLRAALQSEAGPAPYLWESVASAIGIENAEEVVGYCGEEVAAAVQSEAGEVDVVRAVMAQIRRQSVAPEVEIPEPANIQRWGMGALVIAAVAMIVLVMGGLGGPSSVDSSSVDTLQFADAREVIVDDLSYAQSANVQVIQGDAAEGEEGALIIWVDEEAVM